jgi:hypothetical protein
MLVLLTKGGFMNHYHIWASGFVYCVDEYAPSKKAALDQFKTRWGFSRMPRGSFIALAN